MSNRMSEYLPEAVERMAMWPEDKLKPSRYRLVRLAGLLMSLALFFLLLPALFVAICISLPLMIWEETI